MKCGRCQRIAWADLRGELDRVPPKLRHLLDKVFSKSKHKHVFHVRYPYGQLIVNKGRFVAPCEAEPCSECRMLVEETGYSQVPLALLVRNPIEVFIDYPKDEYGFRFAPLRLIPQGELLGVFEVLDALIGMPSSRPGWSVSSGSRSVWVLAPLGNKQTTKELSNEISKGTNSFVDVEWDSEEKAHWQLIQECAVAQDTQWYADLIVFPAVLIERLAPSSDLFNEMLLIGWRYSGALRQSSIEDTSIRDAVSRAARRVTLPVGEMHFYDSMRHFLNLMTGAIPAYRSCHVIKEPAGPFVSFCDLLRKALHKLDRSRPYHPVVMQPHHLEPGETGFYSCRCPSLPGLVQAKPETFLSLTAAYRDVISNFKGEYAEMLNSKSMTLFAMPPAPRCPNCNIVVSAKTCANCGATPREVTPRGITPIDRLQTGDFFPNLSDYPSNELFLKSQFLVSCIRLTRGYYQPDATKDSATK